MRKLVITSLASTVLLMGIMPQTQAQDIVSHPSLEENSSIPSLKIYQSFDPVTGSLTSQLGILSHDINGTLVSATDPDGDPADNSEEKGSTISSFEIFDLHHVLNPEDLEKIPEELRPFVLKSDLSYPNPEDPDRDWGPLGPYVNPGVLITSQGKILEENTFYQLKTSQNTLILYTGSNILPCIKDPESCGIYPQDPQISPYGGINPPYPPYSPIAAEPHKTFVISQSLLNEASDNAFRDLTVTKNLGGNISEITDDFQPKLGEFFDSRNVNNGF